ncbi:MAG: hypothetical protein IJT94_03440 [Oscillibacter sp.]|nr:hypothetical protein [Oscillibacter sp.]
MTAVGETTAGAMTAVGHTVGNAAGKVGLKSVAALAADDAGAATVGTATMVTAGAVGTIAGVDGAIKLSEAKSIKEEAMERYRTAEISFENAQEMTNKRLEELGREKLRIWKSFNRFVEAYSKIQNPPVINGDIKTETVTFSAADLDNIRAVALSVKDILEIGVGSAAIGGLIGFAANGGLAGTLSAGATGASMAGGAIALGGLTFAPMYAVGGIMLSFKGSKALESARDIEQEVNRAVRKMNDAEAELQKVRQLSDAILEELNGLYQIYTDNVTRLEAIVSRQKNYVYFTPDEKKTLERTILSLKLIKMVSMQNILDNEHDGKVLSDDVNKTLESSRATVSRSL